MIAAAKSLKVIGRAGIGVDNVDIPAATAAGVVVMNTPFGNSITTAEHAIAMMFALARQLPAADLSTQAGKWEKNRFMGVELYGKTLGLIGAGNIGSIVADRANGLKMKVIAYDPFLSPERAVEIGVEKVELDDLLARADIITLHTPLTDKTRNILSRRRPGQDQEGRASSSTAPAAAWWTRRRCATALDSGHVGGAAFDVFVEEPAKENILFGAPNFIATPHLGASTSRGAGERRPAGGRADERLSAHRRGDQRPEQPLDHRRGGAQVEALRRPGRKLGAFAGQMVDVGLKAIDIAYEGEVAALNVKPLTAAALAGVLRPMLAEVNMVSAPAVARERGITVSESRQETSPVYDSLMRITVLTETGPARLRRNGDRRRAARGGGQGHGVGRAFAPSMLYVNNLDKPGFIGALGRLLAEAGSISPPSISAASQPGDDAIALVGVDQARATKS